MSITSLRRHLPAIALIIAVTFAVCLPGIARFGGVSLYDEITHVDYAEKISRGHLPSPVEELGEVAMDEWACRPGTWQPENFCDLTVANQTDNEDFPAEGLNYNGFHPPLYYLLTGLGARALSGAASLVTDVSLMISMRIMSAVWLAAGLSALYLVLTRWVRRTTATAATLLVGTTPAVASFGMMVNPDSMAVLASAAALYLAWRLSQGTSNLWWGFGLAFLVASTKLLAVASILVLTFVWMIASYLADKRGGEKQATLTFVGALAGTVVSAITAKLLTGPNLGIANPIAGLSTEPTTGGFLDPFFTALGQNLSPTTPYWMVDGLDTLPWGASARLLGYVLVGATLIVLWSSTTKAHFRIAAATVVGLLAIPIVIQTREVLAHGEYFLNLASRYSLTMIPFAGACLAFATAMKKGGAPVLAVASALSTCVAIISAAF